MRTLPGVTRNGPRPERVLGTEATALTLPCVATNPTGDVTLRDLQGNSYTLDEWLTLFNLLLVGVDPYTLESSWILNTASRLFRYYEGADVRVAFVVTADPDDARRFLGPLAEEFLVFADPDRELVKSAELDRLPALLHLRQDASLAGVAEGWDPEEWTDVLLTLEDDMYWRSRPSLPEPTDPNPFTGSPALA